ncbi:MAG: hypothetical protein K2P81_06030 [Bacteriovoracaceae bacterium]|nr:hypothetical protein [Bacteriovoracaceae bacterium]
MKNLILIVSFLVLGLPAMAQQIGAGAMPLSKNRIGLEAGGYLNRGAGTGALVRYMNTLNDDAAFELGAGGATGSHGSRAFAAIRQQLVKEDVSIPAIYLRGSVEAYKDAESTRRNAIGAGPLFTQGYVVSNQEVYAYIHPRAQIGIETDSNDFVVVTGSSFGLNTNIKSNQRNWIASVEMDMGFQNAANSFMMGLATDI